MNKDNIKTEIIVKEQRIGVLRIDNKEFISLTDLARYADSEEPRLPIRYWMRSKEVISYLGLSQDDILSVKHVKKVKDVERRAKEVLRNQPKDIIQFGIEYFKGLETNTKVDYSNKGENRPENYKRPENQKPNIINAPNNLEISQEDKNRLQRSMDKIDRINKDPVPVEDKHEEAGTQNEVERGRHVVKYEQEETYEKKVMTEEVHVKKEVTVISKQKIIRNGEVKESEFQIKHEEEGGRYGGINNEGSEKNKKEYDDWFTKHSMDKQAIDYKPKKEELDENLKRNEMGYNTWFNNHSSGSINQSQSGEIANEEKDGQNKN